MTNWQAALVIAVVGFAVFASGLGGAFQGDDQNQIVGNTAVHSISNVRSFFAGSTFYSAPGATRLSGTYYRPLMTTMFSLIYTVFGAHPLYFHVVQLLLCVGSAIVVYLVFRYSFGAVLSLALALAFLVHPLNSQVAFAIPSMQDALFFFFGMLAMWLLLRFKSVRSLVFVALCLLLSLLSKETGALFVLMALVYLWWFDRKRLLPFAGTMILPAALYVFLKVHAVGLLGAHSRFSPIDSLSLAHRLMTAPSVMQFYLTKLVFPWKLATAYDWSYSSFSVSHVLVPLVVDVAVIALVVYLARKVRGRATRAMYVTYLFFAVWAGVGLVTILQLFPLDMTACETWFYFAMFGVLGMAGVVLTTFQAKVRPRWFLMIVVLLVCLFGFRTAWRGTDYRSQYILSQHDVAASKEDFAAYNELASTLNLQGKYREASVDAAQSIKIYPTYFNYYNMATASEYLGNYQVAAEDYAHVLVSGVFPQSIYMIYEAMGELTLVYQNDAWDQQFLQLAVQNYPQNSLLWEYKALYQARTNDDAGAKISIMNAAKYGSVDPKIYNNIMQYQQFTLDLDDLGKKVVI